MESDDLDAIINFANTLTEVKKRLKNEYTNVQRRLSSLSERFEKEFSFEDDPYRKGVMEALMWTIMPDILFLYALGQNDSIIIHLHGILERFASRELKKILKTPKVSPTLFNKIERQGLFLSAKILRDFEVIDVNTLKFLKKLNNLRNSVAHKDIEKISNLFGPKENILWIDTREPTSEIDSISIILDSLRSLYQMWEFSKNGNANKMSHR